MTLTAEKTRVLKARMQAPADIRANVGLMVLSTDEIGADAFCSLMPRPATRVFITRTAYLDDDPVTGEFRVCGSYKEVAESFPAAGRLDVLALNCTSATVATGADRILTQLAEARPGLKYSTPGVGGFRALHALRAKRIALLTPYPVAYHRRFVPFFEQQGLQIMADATFDLHSDADIGELTKDCLFDGARAVTRSADVDAIFISCTATPIVPHIEELESELKIPVVTSSQALAWDILRLVDVQSPVAGYGRLMRLPRLAVIK